MEQARNSLHPYQNLLRLLMNSLVDMAPQIVEIGGQILTSLVSGISGSTDQMAEAITQIIISLVGFITDNLPTIALASVKIVLALGKGLVEAAPQMASSIFNMMLDAGKQISALAVMFVNYGKNIVDGLVQGIKDSAMAPIEAVKDVGNKIKQGFMDFFGIHSPSKPFLRKGLEYFMLGPAEGIKDNEGVIAERWKNANRPT